MVAQKSAGRICTSGFGHHAPIIFNKTAFLARVMDDEGLARAIADLFVTDMPVQIEKLASFVRAGHCGHAEYQAHTIRGASANVGGEALREKAFEMETAAEDGDLAALQRLMPELEKCFAELRKAMEHAF